MAQDRGESTKEPIIYERFINRFWPDIMSIRLLKRINTKLCGQKNVYIVQSNMY